MNWRDQIDSPDFAHVAKAMEARIPTRKTVCKVCEHFRGDVEINSVACAVGKICCGGKVGTGPISLAWDECPQLKWCESMFDRVYVISLDRTPQRLEDFRSRFSQIIWPFKKPEVFRAMDGDKLPVPMGILHSTMREMRNSIQQSIMNLDDLKVKGEILIALSKVTDIQNKWPAGGGAWGCMESHRAILRQCIMDDVDSVLIFEDDAEPIPTFNDDLRTFLNNLPPDWDGLMLGGQHFGEPPKEIASGITKVKDCGRTHAYALKGKLLKDVYSMWHSFFNHCDYALGPFMAKYNVYSPNPFLFGQGVNQSQITGRLEPKRFWSGQDTRMKTVLVHCSFDVLSQLRTHGLHTGYSKSAGGVDEGLSLIFKSNKSFNVKLAELRSWIELVSSEAAAFADGVCGIWYPELDQTSVELIKLILGPNFKEIRVNSVESYLEQRTKHDLVTPSLNA